MDGVTVCARKRDYPNRFDFNLEVHSLAVPFVYFSSRVATTPDVNRPLTASLQSKKPPTQTIALHVCVP